MKGPLATIMWADTINDDMAVKPWDLVEADQDKEPAIAEPTDEELMSIEQELEPELDIAA